MGASKGRFSRCRHTLALACANFLEEDATYEKPKKTIGFYRFFAFPRFSARFENQQKIASNTLFERLTPQRALERRHLRFSKRQNGLRGLSGAPRETSCSSSGTLLAANLTPLARPWALLGSFGAALGRSWLALGDASSRKFSKLRLSDPIFLDLGSVWIRKPAKF